MTPGPIQSTLFALCAVISAALATELFRKPAMSYIRWSVIIGVCSALAQDAISFWGLSRPGGDAWTSAYLAAELGGAMAWLHFSRLYARERCASAGIRLSWPMVVGISAILGTLAALPEILTVPATPGASSDFILTIPGFVVRVATLTVLIFALSSLETTLVNSVYGQRWRIKFTILGAFTIMTAQVFMVSLGLLYRTLDPSLTPARQTGFALGALFMLYSAIFRGGETPVQVSKRLARTSVVIFGAGVYLLFLGALGMVLSLTGYSGNKALLMALGLIAGIGFLTLLLSEGVRRRFNRILQNYFYKEKYDYRVQWMSFTKRLSRADSRDTLYRAVLLGFCETFGMGGAVLYLKDQDRVRMFPSQMWEIDQTPPPLEDWKALSRMFDAGMAAVDVTGIRNGIDPSSLAFFEQAKAAFAVQLLHNDVLAGIILLTKPIDASEKYNQEDFDLMEALATQAYSAMLNYKLTDDLAKARSMEIMGKVSTFIVHDLKNLVYALSLILKNATRHIQNPDFQQDMLKGLQNTVSKMHVLISQLRQLPSRENLNLEPSDLLQVVHDTFRHFPEQGLELKGQTTLALVDRPQMQKVVLNLALNALESTGKGNPVIIETGLDKTPFLRVVDSGCGMSDEFIRESLFQPFKTTKSNGMGIGLYQCKQIVEAHGGHIQVESSEGKGSIFTVFLPSPEALSSLENA